MDGRLLANSLVSLRGIDLRMVYALLCNTNIGDLLSSKTKDIFSKEDDHFTKHLEEEVRKLESIEEHVLQLDLFLEMTKLLKLKGTKYSVEKEINDQCGNIVDGVYAQFLKQDKQFRNYAEGQPSGLKLQQMIQFQMNKMFQQLDDSFGDFTIEDQTKFSQQVNEYIQSLPEEKQAKIKDKLGINDITDEVIRKTIATSGASIVFAIIVEVSGFAFYTTATSLLAGLAGVFGVTLPFGVYTGLTSTIAVLASPWFIIPLLLGGGAFLVNQQNKSLKKKLLPIVLMQITLPFMCKEEERISYELFIQEWEGRYKNVMSLHKQLRTIENERMETRQVISEKASRISNYADRIWKAERTIVSERHSIKLALISTNMKSLHINNGFEKHRLEYNAILDDITRLEAEKEKRKEEPGFLKQIGNIFSNLSTSFDVHSLNRKADEVLDLMVDDILQSNSSFKHVENKKIRLQEEERDQLIIKKDEQEKQKKDYEIILAELNVQAMSIEQDIKELEKKNYGLEHLFHDGIVEIGV